ncbi:MAG: NifU family protein [Sedimentisphaerales bacterium]|nr:NifU family protein [Sedimentisphaerales bacterium]
MTEKTFEQRVQDSIDTIRPMLQNDGGDCELVAIEGNVVKIRFRGACQGCPGAAMTLKMGIERRLREDIPEIEEVVAVR